MARLIIHKGENEGMSFEIRGPRFSIGRDLSNDIQLLFPKVSRDHVEIRFEDGVYTLSDRGSRNGTQINGETVESAVLEDHDLVGIGDTCFMFIKDEIELSGPEGRIFRDGDPGLETVVGTVPSWNVDLLKKNLLSSSQLQLQNSKRFLVELYEMFRAFTGFEDDLALLKFAGAEIGRIIKADRVFPALCRPDSVDGWELIAPDDVATMQSLSGSPISRSVFERAAGERISLLMHRDREQEPSASMVTYDIHSALCVPLAEEGNKGEVIGMLYADRLGGGDVFSKDDLEFVTAAAIAVADALREINKVKAIQHREDILSKEVRSRYNIVGESAQIRNVLEFIEKAGTSASVVLIMGESGTGKELISRAIHYVSRRSGEAFKAINCAAISETLLESELFGHVKGAFTGAAQAKAGIFEAADGGSLFLDEIGEMSATGQAKLLRVIEQGEITRVGGTDIQHVDVRLIAATNKDLEQEVQEGRFREDLYHRLNILTLTVPPLRERVGDVRVLLDYFTEQFGRECGRQLGFAPEALKLLEAYGWPGNVRELRNFVERTFILASEASIGVDDLPAKMVYSEKNRAGMSLEAVTREHILRVLDAAEGNKKKAAEILQIDRSTLYARLNAYEKKDQDAEQ